MFLQFWHLWNTQRGFFGLLMRCWYADGSWDFWVLIFVFCFWNMSFLCSSLTRFFVVQCFHFQDSVWLVKKIDVFFVVPFINSIVLAIFAEVDLRCGEFLSEKSWRHKLVVSTSFWSWLLNVSSVLTSLNYTAIFLGLLMRCGYNDDSWEYYVFNFGLYDFEICIFLCLSLIRSFVVQFFQGSLWLVKSTWCVQNCFIPDC